MGVIVGNGYGSVMGMGTFTLNLLVLQWHRINTVPMQTLKLWVWILTRVVLEGLSLLLLGKLLHLISWITHYAQDINQALALMEQAAICVGWELAASITAEASCRLWQTLMQVQWQHHSLGHNAYASKNTTLLQVIRWFSYNCVCHKVVFLKLCMLWELWDLSL